MAFWEPDLSLEAELKFGVPKGRSQEFGVPSKEIPQTLPN